MLDKLPIDQIQAIISESYTLQRILATRIQNGNLDFRHPLIMKIEGIVKEFGDNKIGAIKALRELGSRREIYPLFPKVEFNCDSGTMDLMGLADSKRLVEYVAKSIGTPYPGYE